MKNLSLATILSLISTFSAQTWAQSAIDIILNPPEETTVYCNEVFETISPDVARSIRSAFEAGNDREFYRLLSVNRVTPDKIVDTGTHTNCLGLIFIFPFAKPTNGNWKPVHKEMFDHLIDMGFDVNDRVRNTVSSGNMDLSNEPVIARFGGNNDLTMFKWFLEAGANLYQAFYTDNGWRWYTPLARILEREIRTDWRNLTTTMYVLNELNYPLYEGRTCLTLGVARFTGTYRGNLNAEIEVGRFFYDLSGGSEGQRGCMGVPRDFFMNGGQIDWTLD